MVQLILCVNNLAHPIAINMLRSYMAKPNTLTIQYMVLFSHLTVQLPSVWLSQKQELAVCNPAPFFCIITQVTVNEESIIDLIMFIKITGVYKSRLWLYCSAWGTCNEHFVKWFDIRIYNKPQFSDLQWFSSWINWHVCRVCYIERLSKLHWLEHAYIHYDISKLTNQIMLHTSCLMTMEYTIVWKVFKATSLLAFKLNKVLSLFM